MSIRLMLGTGMRTQEIMALQPHHIAKDGSSIQSGKLSPCPRNTQNRPTQDQNQLPEHPGAGGPARRCHGFSQDDHTYIWHGEKTELCNPSTFRRQFAIALAKVGDVRVLSPHCCRHTYISHLQSMGVDIQTIQSLSGHADIDMTEHYLHVQDEVKVSAVAKLDRIFH